MKQIQGLWYAKYNNKTGTASTSDTTQMSIASSATGAHRKIDDKREVIIISKQDMKPVGMVMKKDIWLDLPTTQTATLHVKEFTELIPQGLVFRISGDTNKKKHVLQFCVFVRVASSVYTNGFRDVYHIVAAAVATPQSRADKNAEKAKFAYITPKFECHYVTLHRQWVVLQACCELCLDEIHDQVFKFEPLGSAKCLTFYLLRNGSGLAYARSHAFSVVKN